MIVSSGIKSKNRLRKDRYYAAHPWANHLRRLRHRCNRDGIFTDLDVRQMETLWARDQAGAMKCPRFIRRELERGFTFSNCFFVEEEDIHRRGL